MIKKIESYFLSAYEMVDSRAYYLKLSIIMGLILTAFVILFDPYDISSAQLKYAVPLSLIQIGYGLNLTFIIYLLYWLIFHRMGYRNRSSPWRTYHHWLLLVLIQSVTGISGTIYHRLFLDVGEVGLNYFVLVTIPRTILISLILFTIAVLLDKLHEKNKRIESLTKLTTNSTKGSIIKNTIPNGTILLKSPILKQSVVVEGKCYQTSNFDLSGKIYNFQFLCFINHFYAIYITRLLRLRMKLDSGNTIFV